MPCIILGTEDTVENKRENPCPCGAFLGRQLTTAAATTKEAEYPVGWINMPHVQKNILERGWPGDSHSLRGWYLGKTWKIWESELWGFKKNISGRGTANVKDPEMGLPLNVWETARKSMSLEQRKQGEKSSEEVRVARMEADLPGLVHPGKGFQLSLQVHHPVTGGSWAEEQHDPVTTLL